MKQKGFVLITAILVIFLMMASMSYVQLKTSSHIRTNQFTSIQMSSMALAESGIAEARKIIASEEIEDILVGNNGAGSIIQKDNSINPVDPSLARFMDFSSWKNENDDGFYRFSPAAGEEVLIKISNNELEPPFLDQDGEVRVRSLGIIKNGLLEGEIPGVKNQVTLLEGIFRKECPFFLPAPLVCFDHRGNWLFEGENFQIRGGPEASVLLLGEHSPEKVSEFELLSAEPATECFDSSVPAAATPDSITGYPNLSRLAGLEFWNHFRNNINKFAAVLDTEGNEPVHKGLLRYTGKAPLLGCYSGILVTGGDVTLAGDFSIEGILLHLGGGELDFTGRSSAKGAVIYIAEGSEEDSSLAIRERARITYSRSAIEAAHRYLPVTHLGTRIIFE